MPTWTKKTLFAILGIAAFSAVSLGIYMAMLPGEEPERVAIVATTTFTSITTEPVVTTTTLSPSTTTTVPPTTVPEATEPTLPGFYWGTEPAPLGFLKENPVPDLYGGRFALLSGVLLEVSEQDLDFPWEAEPVTLWVARFDLGEHPQTGDLVVGEFVLATEIYGKTTLGHCRMGGRWLPADPGLPDNTTNGTTRCSQITAERAASLLRAGKQYPIKVFLDMDCAALPIEYLDSCEQFMLGEGTTLLPYNRAVVAALRSGEVVPEGMGLLNQLYIPLPSPVPPL